MGGRTLTVLPAIIAPHGCWLGAGRRLDQIAIVQDAGQGFNGGGAISPELLPFDDQRVGHLLPLTSLYIQPKENGVWPALWCPDGDAVAGTDYTAMGRLCQGE